LCSIQVAIVATIWAYVARQRDSGCCGVASAACCSNYDVMERPPPWARYAVRDTVDARSERDTNARGDVRGTFAIRIGRPPAVLLVALPAWLLMSAALVTEFFQLGFRLCGSADASAITTTIGAGRMEVVQWVELVILGVWAALQAAEAGLLTAVTAQHARVMRLSRRNSGRFDELRHEQLQRTASGRTAAVGLAYVWTTRTAAAMLAFLTTGLHASATGGDIMLLWSLEVGVLVTGLFQCT